MAQGTAPATHSGSQQQHQLDGTVEAAVITSYPNCFKSAAEYQEYLYYLIGTCGYILILAAFLADDMVFNALQRAASYRQTCSVRIPC